MIGNGIGIRLKNHFWIVAKAQTNYWYPGGFEIVEQKKNNRFSRFKQVRYFFKREHRVSSLLNCCCCCQGQK